MPFDDDQNSKSLAPATTFDAYLAVPVVGALARCSCAARTSPTRVGAGISGADIVERATPRMLWIGLAYRPR